jgi:tetratricopeptide (TPR) repeat protein
MHCENARFEFFLRAMTNAADVRLQATSAPPQTWPQWFTPDIVKIYTYFAHRWQRPPLPAVFTTLQEDYTPDFFRLKAALSQLSQSSLVIHNSATNAYSMHPLVHTWAREVPGISTVEKARWAECAATLIADCISLSTPEDAVRLPEPGEDEGQIAQRDQRRQRQQEEQEDLRRYLLPHVDHVRGQQRAIELELKTERDEMQKNWLLKHWPVMERGFSRERALMFAKFSVVYAEHARWEDARDLQIMVKDFTMKYLGIGHASTRRISLFLAETYIHLSQPDLAEELQVKVVNACVSKHDKLIAQQRLAESRRLQGFLTHSRELLEEAVDGLTELLGETHEDTLNAVDFLGRTLVMYHDDKLYTVARTLHRKAYDGIRKIHGRNSLKALLAGENLSVTAVCTHEPEHLREAHDMMIHILETRKEKLGREHAYTLLATVNLARVKAEMGFLSDAEGLIEYGLPIAKRNLGADHIAYLWGRYELAKVMTKQERWEASEALLKDNIVRQKQVFEKRGGHHPDVIGGLIEYATVLNALERYEDCERIVEEALESLAKLSTTSVDHPLASKLKASCARWRQTRGT